MGVPHILQGDMYYLYLQKHKSVVAAEATKEINPGIKHALWVGVVMGVSN